MAPPIIQVRNLGKAYRLGAQAGLQRTLPEAVAAGVTRLLRRERRATSSEPFWALRDVSFDVAKGEVVGIIGHNGAGKSTLLKILSQITDPTKGEAILRGRVASLLEVGTGFHPELTGRENIYLNGAVLGMNRREIARKFDAIVDFSGVEAFLDTPVKRYSSGMTVRLAFAVAAHLEPEILVIDEVLAVGDASFQRKCLGKMSEVSRSGRTVLFVSHNMGAVQQLCERAIWLSQGRIEMDGDPREVVRAYLDHQAEHADGSNLAAVPRRDDLGRYVRLTACRVLNQHDETVDRVGFAAPFSIEVEATGTSDLGDVSLVVGIESPTAGRVLTSASEEADAFISVEARKTLRARLKLDQVRLSPGSYTVTLGIRTQRGPLDHIEHAHRFEVIPLMHDGRTRPNELPGVVQIDPQWQLPAPMNRAALAHPVGRAA